MQVQAWPNFDSITNFSNDLFIAFIVIMGNGKQGACNFWHQ
jgi:hypothetical protein